MKYNGPNVEGFARDATLLNEWIGSSEPSDAGQPAKEIEMTVTDAASRLGIAKRTVQLWCERLGIEKHGVSYWPDESDIERIRASMGKIGYPKGRPRKTKPSE